MEKRLEEQIEQFLTVSYGYGDGYGYGYGSGYGYGYGYGSGYGYGYGYGSGSGSGDGDGSGDGSGDGYGYGYGYGDGDGITEFKGKKVYQIDSVPTLIDKVHGSYAVGSILNNDFTLTPCYIAKAGNSFAHGETLKKAKLDAEAKELERMPIEERIKKFHEAFPDANTKIPARQLYDWHHILTGSCQMGRDQFAHQHDIDIDHDEFTVCEFVSLTCHSYGSDSIKRLAESYGIKL